jgi:hypothetical protein
MLKGRIAETQRVGLSPDLKTQSHSPRYRKPSLHHPFLFLQTAGKDSLGA